LIDTVDATHLDQMTTIKRYSNRKLYNTDACQYVTLEEIAGILKANGDVRVIDHRTGADLTTLTLLQVVLEQERQIGGLLPAVLLKRIIQRGDQKIQLVKESLQSIWVSHRQIDDEISKRTRALVSSEKISNEEAERIRALLINLEPVGTSESDPSVGNSYQLAIEQLHQELDSLRQELQALKIRTTN